MSPTVLKERSSLYNLVSTLPTMQLGHLVTSLGVIYQIICSFLWSHKRLHATFFTSEVELPKTCKHS